MKKDRGWRHKFLEAYCLLKLPPASRKLIWHVVRQRLTYLSIQRLAAISKAVKTVGKSSSQGIFIEAGCALGGSTAIIAKHKPAKSLLYVYDVFGQIPPPSDKDPQAVKARYQVISEGEAKGIQGDPYYGYERDLYNKVIQNLVGLGIDLEKDQVQLIQGDLHDTLQPTQAVAFAHIDVDWYAPVYCCLKRIFPKLLPGGVLIIDDYNDWSGCRQATDDFLKTVTGQFTTLQQGGALQVWKK